MIIVNDSPDDTSYLLLEKTISDPRIIYLKNKLNSGVNFSRNRALDAVAKDSDWVIFLDDDDYFAPDTLAFFYKLSTMHREKKWFVTNRSYESGERLTFMPGTNTTYSYILSYLLLKRCRGDVTHLLSSSLVKNIRFSKKIKQGEEWFFFYQLGLKNKFFYSPHNSTLSDGYDEQNGLNFRKQSKAEKIKNILTLFVEGSNIRLTHHPSFVVYILSRAIKAVIS